MSDLQVGPFDVRLRKHLELRRSMGQMLKGDEFVLKQFDRFAHEHSPRADVMTRELVVGFLDRNRQLSPATRMHKVVTLRQFARYLFQFEPKTYIPERSLVPTRPVFLPHIYSLAETQELMRLAAELPPAGSLRPLTTVTVIGLLWVSGLRLGEVCRLNREDVDLENGTLHVQKSKYFKSRLIPLKASAVSALSAYRRERDRRGHDQSGKAPFFINQRFRRLQLPGFEQTFRELTDPLGLKCPAGHRARLHDFRHSLATRCLAESYDVECDPAARLSILATFLGHANVTETATYLHPSSAVLDKAAELFQAHVQKRRDLHGSTECPQ
jgi:integrase